MTITRLSPISLIVGNEWSIDSFFHTPSKRINTICKRVPVHSNFICPLFNGHSFTINLKKMGRSFIVHLNLVIRPTTISRLIISIIINPIKTQSMLVGMPNILIKILKAIFPRVANPYSSCSVGLETIHIFVVTAIQHISPNKINACFTKSVRFIVRILSSITSTGNRVTSFNIARIKNFFFTALTPHQPSTISMKFYESPSTNLFTC